MFLGLGLGLFKRAINITLSYIDSLLTSNNKLILVNKEQLVTDDTTGISTELYPAKRIQSFPDYADLADGDADLIIQAADGTYYKLNLAEFYGYIMGE